MDGELQEASRGHHDSEVTRAALTSDAPHKSGRQSKKPNRGVHTVIDPTKLPTQVRK
jgi:hypothetical protein